MDPAYYAKIVELQAVARKNILHEIKSCQYFFNL
jgi:hypothetical protein